MNGDAPQFSSLSSASIPTKPTAILCGKLQSREFTDGAYALAAAIREIDQLRCDDETYLNNEHLTTAALAGRITMLLDRGGEARAGAIAAIANWIVIDIGGCCPEPEDWTPLEADPAFDKGDSSEQPHALASFFDVAGAPVSVTPDLLALKWVDDGYCEYQKTSVDVVRAIGKPITRRRFDQIRASHGHRPR
jgi:hypothetical protein